MATTLFLKLTKPVSEHDAQKVATYNAAVDDLDGITAGFLSLSVAGSTDVTLTRSQGLSKLFKFTGALTGSIVVFLPVDLGSTREFVVWNATTGAHTLTVKTTAGGSSGVAVTQGTKTILAHDDTDVFAAAATGGGGTTINATDTVIPYRSSGTAFTDSSLTQISANVLAVQNGTSAQTIYLYGYHPDGSNYQRTKIYGDGGGSQAILAEGAGSGAGPNLVVGGSTSAGLQLWSNNTVRWSITSAGGDLLASTDNAYDIGATAASRPRTVYIATKAVSPIVQYTSFTVSTLPTPTAGMTAYVTDGDAGLAWGATVVNTGAGATKYLVWYNGTNWTVMGK